nr:helix-turn-helix domain-containing protein [Actinoplanes auranticolor]
MPRQERPLESEETPLLRFAGDLRRLRRRAGLPSYRELGKRTSYSAAALSEALSGRRLPSLAVTTAIVRACGGDTGEWTGRWRQLAAAQPGADSGVPPPYVGLAPYQVDDADRFFGREALTDTLLTPVAERPFVGIFGSSGAGKSSLLRAGLVARSARTAIVVRREPIRSPSWRCPWRTSPTSPPTGSAPTSPPTRRPCAAGWPKPPTICCWWWISSKRFSRSATKPPGSG